MMTDRQTTTYEDILDIIRHWPTPTRLTLIHDIVNTLTTDLTVSEPTLAAGKRNTLKQAQGLLATDQPAPTDTEIQSWLEMYRLEKYS